MNPRFFWLLSDNKTVREISEEEWKEIANKERNRKDNTRRICKIDDTEIVFVKGSEIMWIPRVQLEKILESEEG